MWTAVTAAILLLLEESERSPDSGARVTAEWLISPITNFASEPL
jgi:hypothetical protein